MTFAARFCFEAADDPVSLSTGGRSSGCCCRRWPRRTTSSSGLVVLRPEMRLVALRVAPFNPEMPAAAQLALMSF